MRTCSKPARARKILTAVALISAIFSAGGTAYAVQAKPVLALVYSTSVDLSSPKRLAHASLAAPTYIYIGGDTGPVESVSWYLDDAIASKAPAAKSTAAPFALPVIDPAATTPGRHTLLAVLTDVSGVEHDLFARFQVAGTPAQPPTTTSASHMFGAFTYGSPDDGMTAFNAVESKVGKFDLIQWFQDWSTPFDTTAFAAAASSGHTPLIAWEPVNVDVAGVTSGAYDTYLQQCANEAKAFGKDIYLRPFPEMNGDWATWNGNPAENVRAWQHVVTLFRATGATNVKWVWSPNETDEPATAANKMEAYYPGDAYVDILAFDAYNWGANGPNGWRSFDEVVSTVYNRVSAIGPQPIWATEIASSPVGGDKAAWIADMFTAASNYSRLQAIVWFDENKEQDWRLTADPLNATAAHDTYSKWHS